MSSFNRHDLGLLLLRLGAGGVLMAHGTQKLFGWFGGHGIEGTGQFMESIGYKPGKASATASGLAETCRRGRGSSGRPRWRRPGTPSS
ncbi:DoxX family protein, partial [Streptomyces nigra]